MVRDGAVRAVVCRDLASGEDVTIECGFVLNCAGPWAARIAQMAGCEDVEVVPGRGIMIAMNHRLVNRVINRLTPPSDGDILVPVHTVCIIGTTDQRADDPDRLAIPRAEVRQMLAAGEALVPGFREARAVHAWAGARPLVGDRRAGASATRHMSRALSLPEHAGRDGLRGLLTMAGGKLTTYRLMAEQVVDAMVAQLGDKRPCRTADECVPGATPDSTYFITERLAAREADRLDDQILCECELMTKTDFVRGLEEQPGASLDDLRRRLRFGMGPCQGGFCALRTAGVSVETGHRDAAQATAALGEFLQNRWIGLWPILAGDQVRQAALDNWIWRGTLNLEHVPSVSASLPSPSTSGLKV